MYFKVYIGRETSICVTVNHCHVVVSVDGHMTLQQIINLFITYCP